MTADTMMQHPDQRLKPAFLQSVVFHVALFGGFALWAWWNAGITLGDPIAGGEVASLESVDRIPLPSQGPPNPVANDTKSIAPPEIEKPAPKPEPVQKTPEPEKAEPLPELTPAKQTPRAPKNPLPDFSKQLENQLRSKSPQQASAPLLQPLSNGGSGGSNMEAVMGQKFGYYAKQIQEITGRNWHHEDVGQSEGSPTATVRFTLLRNGSVRNVRLIRHSMTAMFDESVTEAIETAKYPPLPPEYDKNSVDVEFTFELKR